MKEYLKDCYSLQDLTPTTERSYLDLDNNAFVYSVMITNEIYGYFKKDKSRILEYLSDTRIIENTLTDGVLLDQYYQVKYQKKNYILKYKEDSFRRECLDDYNVELNFDIIPELCEIQDEFPYKWLQVGFELERFNIYEEDLEKI